MKLLAKIFILGLFVTNSFAIKAWLNEAPYRMKWDEAVKFCLEVGAELPTREDFKEIWLRHDKSSNIKGFDISVSYWTKDEVKNNKYAAYPFYFMEGKEDWYYKADRYGVRCIVKK